LFFDNSHKKIWTLGGILSFQTAWTYTGLTP